MLLCVGSADAFSTRSVRFYGTGGDTRVDRIKVPVDPQVPADVGSGDFTVEMWMRGTLADNDTPTSGFRTETESGSIDWIYGNIIVDRDLWGEGPDWGMSIHRDGSNRGILRFGTEEGPPGFAQHTLQGRLPVLDGAWHHIAFVRERSTGVKRIYVDGVLDVASSLGVSTTDLSYPSNGMSSNPDSDPFVVFAAEKHGYTAQSGYPSFSGWMDDIRIWNVARTGAQIDAARSVSLAANTPGLVLYLRLEEGTGTNLIDATGGDTATLWNGVAGDGEWRTEVPPSAVGTTTSSLAPTTSTSSSSTSSSSTSTSSTSSSSSTTVSSTTSSTSAAPTTTSSSSSSSTTRTTTTTSSPPTTVTSTSTSSTAASPSTTSTTVAPGAGPIAAYAFGENGGGTTADATGRGNNGTLNGATWRTGAYGSALNFDGNDWVNVLDGADLDITAALTLEAWINPSQIGGWRTILSKTTSGTPTNYYFALNGGELAFGFYTTGWREHTTSGVNLGTGTWVHVAAVFDGTADTVRLYVGGVQRLVGTETGTPTVNTNPLRIGIGFTSEAFAGGIDEVRVYRRALTGPEIVTDMNQPIGGGAPSTTSTSSTSTSSSSTSSTSSSTSSSLPPSSTTSTSRTTTTTSSSSTTSSAPPATTSTSSTTSTSTSSSLPPSSTTSTSRTTTTTSSSSTTSSAPPATSSTSTSTTTSSSSSSSSSLPATTTSTTIPAGLVGGWGFDETSGSTVVDESGNGNQGTITGAVRTNDGRFGRALTFDGSGDWVTVPDDPTLDLTTAFTLEAWVYPTGTSTVARPIAGKERSQNPAYYLNAATAGVQNPSANVRAGGNNLTVTAGSALALNTWSHVAATYDGSALRLYVNGTLAAQQAASGGMTASTRPFRIGHNNIEGGIFAGRIDEVRVYSRALTAQQIQNDMVRAVP